MAAGDRFGFRVDLAALERHAGLVDDIAVRVGQARDAGASVLVGGGAYGVLCAFLPLLLEPAQRQTVDTLTDLAAGLRATASRVQTAARSYARLDDGHANAYRRVGAR
jgi:Excreted virulence factor EspC, type VII ESX diderm